MPSLAKTVLQVLAAGRLTSAATFRNPIFSGFHPDPSFLTFPSLPIYASRDLVYWSHISNALSRPEQLPQLAFLARGATSGVYAPALRHRDGHFYILTTLADQALPGQNYTRWDNFVLSTRDPWGGETLLTPVKWEAGGWPEFAPISGTMEGDFALPPIAAAAAPLPLAPPRRETLRRVPARATGDAAAGLLAAQPDGVRRRLDAGLGPDVRGAQAAHTRFRFSIDMEFGENGGRKTMMTREDQEVGVTALQDQSLPVGTSGFRLRR
ncbi:Non-reducing end alpha-L-arabinofuranosidase BoGH43A [Apiospora saccharicola]